MLQDERGQQVLLHSETCEDERNSCLGVEGRLEPPSLTVVRAKWSGPRYVRYPCIVRPHCLAKRSGTWAFAYLYEPFSVAFDMRVCQWQVCGKGLTDNRNDWREIDRL